MRGLPGLSLPRSLKTGQVGEQAVDRAARARHSALRLTPGV